MKYILTFLGLLATLLAGAQTEAPWSLAKCIAHAQANNLTVQQAALDHNSAEVSLELARQQRYPNLTGSASVGFTNGSSIDPITSDYVSQQITSSDFGLNSQFTLYAGGQIDKQITQQQLQAQQNYLLVEAAQSDITFSIINAYLQALYLQENISIAQHSLAASERQLEVIKARQQAGEATAQAVAEIEAQRSTQAYQIVTAENAYTQQVLTLKQLLELPPEQSFTIDTDIQAHTQRFHLPALDSVYQQARTTMPQMQAAELDNKISYMDLEIAKAGYLPTVTANARLYTGQTSTRELDYFNQLNNNFNQQIGLSVSVPILDRKQTSSRIQEAMINMERARLSQTATEKALYRDIETAWQNARAAQSEAEAASAASESTSIAYTMAQQQYELGELTAADLLLSQNNYINAQQQYLQAKYSSLLYYSLLEFYLGHTPNF